jgi:hypothetical protein
MWGRQSASRPGSGTPPRPVHPSRCRRCPGKWRHSSPGCPRESIPRFRTMRRSPHRSCARKQGWTWPRGRSRRPSRTSVPLAQRLCLQCFLGSFVQFCFSRWCFLFSKSGFRRELCYSIPYLGPAEKPHSPGEHSRGWKYGSFTGLRIVTALRQRA